MGHNTGCCINAVKPAFGEPGIGQGPETVFFQATPPGSVEAVVSWWVGGREGCLVHCLCQTATNSRTTLGSVGKVGGGGGGTPI